MFCPIAVTHPGVLCGHKETVFTSFRAPLRLVFFPSQKKGQRKGGGEKVLKKQGDGGKLTKGFFC